MKTALFVDFDNIYIGLSRNEPRAATLFATEPARWLRWIEEGMPVEGDARGAEPRAVLVRKCYLNPRTFQAIRPYFVRSAFEVIDCPPLTLQGKTSADIRMVMDVLDALEHRTRFDEFIILSGDADFTPVLLRLRAHDRRTAVLAIGFAAEAYKAGCDMVIDEDDFIGTGLGLPPEAPASIRAAQAGDGEASSPPGAAPAEDDGAPRTLLERIGAEILREASHGPIPANELPRVYRRFPEFTPTSNWLGYRSLRGLTDAVVAGQPGLSIDEGDPWSVVGAGGEAGNAQAGNAALRRQIVESVRRLVASSPGPVGMAWASQKVRDELGKGVIESRWAGAGTFGALLRSVPDLGFDVDTSHGGRLYDPERHPQSSPDPLVTKLAELPQELVDLIRRVNHVTQVPALTPAEYAAVFAAVACYLRENPFHPYQIPRPIEEALHAEGCAVSARSVLFVLRGVIFGGMTLNAAPYDWPPEAFAGAFHKNVLNMCENQGLTLSQDERDLVRQWLVGGERSPENGAAATDASDGAAPLTPA